MAMLRINSKSLFEAMTIQNSILFFHAKELFFLKPLGTYCLSNIDTKDEIKQFHSAMAKALSLYSPPQ
jgi:hypothetical protein